jgi:hypothetical protein
MGGRIFPRDDRDGDLREGTGINIGRISRRMGIKIISGGKGGVKMGVSVASYR